MAIDNVWKIWWRLEMSFQRYACRLIHKQADKYTRIIIFCSLLGWINNVLCIDFGENATRTLSSIHLTFEVKYTDIAKFAGHLPHRYGNSRAIWDHTRQRWHSRLYPSRSWYSIKRPQRDARLSWPSWLVTARDGIPAQRRSPVPVVTGPDVR